MHSFVYHRRKSRWRHLNQGLTYPQFTIMPHNFVFMALYVLIPKRQFEASFRQPCINALLQFLVYLNALLATLNARKSWREQMKNTHISLSLVSQSRQPGPHASAIGGQWVSLENLVLTCLLADASTSVPRRM